MACALYTDFRDEDYHAAAAVTASELVAPGGANHFLQVKHISPSSPSSLSLFHMPRCVSWLSYLQSCSLRLPPRRFDQSKTEATRERVRPVKAERKTGKVA